MSLSEKINAITQQYVEIVPGGQVQVSRMCSVKKERYAITIPFQNFQAWQKGLMAQEAFPDLTADQREFLITNLTPDEFERFFKDCD